MAGDFHAYTAKGLFYCKHGRLDMQTPVAFLTTHVKAPDQDDSKKLLCKMVHLHNAKDMVLTLEADDLKMMQWHIDASFAVHIDVCGHTGGTVTMGKGSTHSKSIKQKINGKSGAETEVIGVDDALPQALWTNYFMKAQGWTHNTTTHQDNKSATSLENNGRLSSGNRTKHINVRCHFIKDAIE